MSLTALSDGQERLLGFLGCNTLTKIVLHVLSNDSRMTAKGEPPTDMALIHMSNAEPTKLSFLICTALNYDL